MSLSPVEIDRLADAIADRLAARIGERPAADELLDVHGAAEVLGCSVPTIERAVRRGELPSLRVGRLRRFRRSDLLGLNGKGGCDE